MVESTEGKFLETDKNHIEVVSPEKNIVGNICIDNFTEISVDVQYARDIPYGIRCKFGKIKYEATFTKMMSEGVNIDYDLLKFVVMDRLHLILNERFFPMDYVKKGILYTRTKPYDVDNKVIGLDLDNFILDVVEFATVESKPKMVVGTFENFYKGVSKKENKKEEENKKEKNKKENRKNKNKRIKNEFKVK